MLKGRCGGYISRNGDNCLRSILRKLECHYRRCILEVIISTLTFQANQLKKFIEDMAEQSLRCIAFAYRNLDLEDVPSEEQRINWQLPDDDLTLIGIAGMKVYVQYLQMVNYVADSSSSTPFVLKYDI